MDNPKSTRKVESFDSICQGKYVGSKLQTDQKDVSLALNEDLVKEQSSELPMSQDTKKSKFNPEQENQSVAQMRKNWLQELLSHGDKTNRK